MLRLSLILSLASAVYATTAPSFRGDLLGGGRLSLEEKLGSHRMVLVSFWASWCVPCLEELKQVSKSIEKETNLPLDVLTVNVDTGETASGVRSVMRDQKFVFPVVLDPKHEIFLKYSPTGVLPYSVLVAPNGTIAQLFVGYHEDMFVQVKAQIAKLKESL